MTVTASGEHVPLMEGGRKSTYSSVTYEQKLNVEGDDDDESQDFCLDTLGHVIARKPSGPGDGGRRNGAHRHSSALAPPDKIVYTWHDLNAFTSTQQSRRWRAWPWRRQHREDQRKHILNHVSGVAHPGELLAIMGASGAGKTTLLNTLMFRSPSNMTVTGQRSINGVPASRAALTSLSAYLQQDDLFIPTLTVREHLVFQALVRMDRHIPYSQRMSRVEEVISDLALSKCKDTIIGCAGRIKGISGGEMKRLSFASEVLTNPPLMFCDEPTSGLDSFMAQNVVSVLKSMALRGKTIVSTIHQPSSEVFALFDKVLLMAEGRVAFLGTTEQACDFFKGMGAPCPRNYNPADFFIQLLAVVPTREESCRQTIEMVCDAFDKSEAGIKLAAETEVQPEVKGKLEGSGGFWGDDYWNLGEARQRSRYKASWFAQFRAVLWRSWLSVRKEPVLTKVRLLQTVMVAVLVSIIYFGQKLDQDGVMNINGALFVCLTNMTFQNLFAVINVFCRELPVFLREHMNGMYRVDVYFLCKTIAEIPIFIAIPLVFTVIIYYMIGLNPGVTHFFLAGAIIMLVANVATSFGYLISCVSTNESMALSIGPPIVIPFMLFGGFFLNAGSVPPYLQWLSYLSWFKYGNEALLINQWQSITAIDCSQDNTTTCPKDGHVILETLNFRESDFTTDIVALVALIVGFRVCAYLALLSKTLRSE